MIDLISIKNFKALKSAQFSLSNLNIIAGVNSVGKSSFIQSLLLLRQSYENNLITKGLLLNGEYAQLGTGSDVLNQDTEDDQIAFFIKFHELNKKTIFSYDYQYYSDMLPLSDSADIGLESKFADTTLFSDTKFKYLSADRYGPQDNYKASHYNVEVKKSIGIYGEYTPHFICNNASKQIFNEKLKHDKAKDHSLINNINAWLSEISPNISFTVEEDTRTNSVYLNYSVQKNKLMPRRNIKPKNVGFGLSIALPVLTLLLNSEPDDLIIIENPEAHLHPYAQSIIGRLCAAAASNGTQIILETHSDHVVNGVRIAVKQGLISNDLASIFYFEPNDNWSSPIITKTIIDQDGRLDVWPKGFMDQWDNELDELL